MDRQKTRINGFFEREEESVTTTISRKLLEITGEIEINRVEERNLPVLMAEYLGEERANTYENVQFVMGLIKAFLINEDEFEKYTDRLLDICKNKAAVISSLEELEELLNLMKEAEIFRDGSGIDLARIEFELSERLREKGKVFLTKEEKTFLLEPILMEQAGEIKNARELVKARVDAALENMKKQSKNKFFHFPTEKMQEEKDKLKNIKRFAKEKLAKVAKGEISEDDRLLNL